MARAATAGPSRSAGRTVATVIAALVGAALIVLAVIDASASAGSANARNQTTLIAPASAGGGWDGAARELQQVMRSEGIVNNAQVVNIPGAGGTIGLSQVSGMSGDASTLMVMGITMLGAININGSGVDMDDITPIARITDDYDVLVVPADSPYDSVDDLVAAWAEDPRSFPFGGGSLGSVDQMIIAQLAQQAGIDPTDVNYIAYSGGAELATSLLSGTIDASVSGYADFKGQIEAGKLKALAVSAPEPVESLPYPTLVEEGYDVVLTNWRGIVAPPGITEEERAELEDIVTETVSTPAWADALERNQWTDSFLVGEEFEQNLAEERATVDQIWSDLGY
ncbi:tripartite tricarboxylate transporter substrate-binding protein [Citricoccus sp.]|uniref:Bug family tripartite tricarboxylate transporter substrate binding protein n=1 Tax=Citricoccus sp. TaxID=1978372 RepID=UPI0028BF5790|nr:tripartite tricarboxylate transporter substrate-binding protein [Citricoccus sp.]